MIDGWRLMRLKQAFCDPTSVAPEQRVRFYFLQLPPASRLLDSVSVQTAAWGMSETRDHLFVRFPIFYFIFPLHIAAELAFEATSTKQLERIDWTEETQQLRLWATDPTIDPWAWYHLTLVSTQPSRICPLPSGVPVPKFHAVGSRALPGGRGGGSNGAQCIPSSGFECRVRVRVDVLCAYCLTLDYSTINDRPLESRQTREKGWIILSFFRPLSFDNENRTNLCHITCVLFI